MTRTKRPADIQKRASTPRLAAGVHRRWTRASECAHAGQPTARAQHWPLHRSEPRPSSTSICWTTVSAACGTGPPATPCWPLQWTGPSAIFEVAGWAEL